MAPTSRQPAKKSSLPAHDFSPLWVDHQVAEVAVAVFSDWLEADLARLEERFRRCQTPRSIYKSLDR